MTNLLLQYSIRWFLNNCKESVKQHLCIFESEVRNLNTLRSVDTITGTESDALKFLVIVT